MSRAIRSTAIFLSLFALNACKAVTLATAPDLATARAYVDGFASAIEQRFTRVVRTPRFTKARLRLARFALTPSKLVADTSIWTGFRSTSTGVDRQLEIAAGMNNGHYSFVDRPQVVEPTRIGDERHFIELRQLDRKDDWMWTAEVDHNIGAMPPARATDVFRALFASAERPSSAVRADYRAAFPRTGNVLGRLFTVDSINTTPLQDGSTLVALHILVDDAGLRNGYPAFARFVARYIEPTRYHVRLSDRQGADWLDAQAAKQRVIVRFRSCAGELQPLLGVARRMPDSLLISVDMFTKLSFFTVGVAKMSGDFVHVHTATERGWAMRFAKEPDWQLPLFTESMLHAPLKRPFEGPGIVFGLGLKSTGEGQTVIARRLDAAIRESAIVRFLGSLGFGAMNDYAGAVEVDEHRFIAESFAAMRADIAATKP